MFSFVDELITTPFILSSRNVLLFITIFNNIWIIYNSFLLSLNWILNFISCSLNNFKNQKYIDLSFCHQSISLLIWSISFNTSHFHSHYSISWFTTWFSLHNPFISIVYRKCLTIIWICSNHSCKNWIGYDHIHHIQIHHTIQPHLHRINNHHLSMLHKEYHYSTSIDSRINQFIDKYHIWLMI